jgi:hypothetical protein
MKREDVAVDHHHQGMNVKMRRKEANEEVPRTMMEMMMMTNKKEADEEGPRKMIKMMSN